VASTTAPARTLFLVLARARIVPSQGGSLSAPLRMTSEQMSKFAGSLDAWAVTSLATTYAVMRKVSVVLCVSGYVLSPLHLHLAGCNCTVQECKLSYGHTMVRVGRLGSASVRFRIALG